MKPHHSAAHALVGWYLMLPPPYYIGIAMANWQRRAVFDTKAQCQTERLKLIQHPPEDLSYRGQIIGNPQCVSSGDPRVKP